MGRLVTAMLTIRAGIVCCILLLELTIQWPPFLIYPCVSVLGFCRGIIDVARRMIPLAIFKVNPRSPLTVTRINTQALIVLQISTIAGAIVLFFLIKWLGIIFAMSHVLPLFAMSAAFFYNIPLPRRNTQRTLPSKQIVDVNKTKRYLESNKTTLVAFMSNFYCQCHLVFSRTYWWLVPLYVLPQVLHNLLTLLLLPTYAILILQDAALEAILDAACNIGEMIGAIMILLFANRNHSLQFLWVKVDCFMLLLLWLFLLPTDSPVAFTFGMAPVLFAVNAFYAASDISILSYIQTSFSGMEKSKQSSVSPFIGFLNAVIFGVAAMVTASEYDYFAGNNGVFFAWLWIPCVMYSILGGIIFMIAMATKPPVTTLNNQIQIENAVDSNNMHNASTKNVK
jgi:hypothetical protein